MTKKCEDGLILLQIFPKQVNQEERNNEYVSCSNVLINIITAMRFFRFYQKKNPAWGRDWVVFSWKNILLIQFVWYNHLEFRYPDIKLFLINQSFHQVCSEHFT